MDQAKSPALNRLITQAHAASINIAKLGSDRQDVLVRTFLTLGAAISLTFCSAVSAAGAESPDVLQAKGVATTWLAKLDADDFSECWNLLASHSRNRVSRWRWNLQCKMGRFTFGKATARKLKSAEASTKSPSGRSGEFVLVKFETQSEKKGGVMELVGVEKDHDNQWRVGGYGVGRETISD